MGESKLFVGGLPHECDEALLQSAFAMFGNIVHVEMKRDATTGVGRGFGFITFETEEQAAAALATTPHQVGGKAVEVKYPQPKGSAQRSPSASGGCNGGAWSSGAWSGADAAWNSGAGESWEGGWGWEGKGGSWKGGCKGGWGAPAGGCMGNGGGAKHDFNPAKIFAGGLPKDSAGEDDITHYFSRFGPVSKVEMKIDPNTGISRGFCFVTFESPLAAQAALAARNEHNFNGKWIDVKSADPNGAPVAGAVYGAPPVAWDAGYGCCGKGFGGFDAYGCKGFDACGKGYGGYDAYGCGGCAGKGYGGAFGWGGGAPPAMHPAMKGGKGSISLNPCKLFVGGLAGIGEEELYSFFSQFGEVKSCELKKDHATGKPRGFGFVELSTEEQARAAVRNAANNVISGKWIEVRPADGPLPSESSGVGPPSGKGGKDGMAGKGVTVLPPARGASGYEDGGRSQPY